MRNLQVVLLVLGGLVLLESSAGAQALVDFRVGGLFSTTNQPENKIDNVSVGLKITGPLGKVGNASLVVDYVPISKEDFHVPAIGDFVRVREHGVLISPAVGFYVVKTKKGLIGLNLGITVLGKWQTLSFRSRYNQWQNVCYLSAFDEFCTNSLSLVGSYGGGFRYVFY